MKVESIFIKKFRAFNNCLIHLEKKLTIIAGQNGTQKATLLGLLSQPFSITDKTTSLFSEKTLYGVSYKSEFAVQKYLEKGESLYKSLMQEYFG